MKAREKTLVKTAEIWHLQNNPNFKVRVLKAASLVIHVQNLDDWGTNTYLKDEFVEQYTK